MARFPTNPHIGFFNEAKNDENLNNKEQENRLIIKWLKHET